MSSLHLTAQHSVQIFDIFSQRKLGLEPGRPVGERLIICDDKTVPPSTLSSTFSVSSVQLRDRVPFLMMTISGVRFSSLTECCLTSLLAATPSLLPRVSTLLAVVGELPLLSV